MATLAGCFRSRQYLHTIPTRVRARQTRTVFCLFASRCRLDVKDVYRRVNYNHQHRSREQPLTASSPRSAAGEVTFFYRNPVIISRSSGRPHWRASRGAVGTMARGVRDYGVSAGKAKRRARPRRGRRREESRPGRARGQCPGILHVYQSYIHRACKTW